MSGEHPPPDPERDAAEEDAAGAAVVGGAPEEASDQGTDQDAPDAASQRVRPVDLRDYADFDRDRANRVRVLATDVLTVDLWCLEPQQSTEALHFDDTDVVYTVLGGNAWFVTDEGELGLGPLGAMLVPAGIVHGFDNRTADPLIVVASGSPPDVPADEVTTDEPVDDASEAVFRPGDRLTLRERIRRSLR